MATGAELGNMVVSISRHRNSYEDINFTCQFKLYDIFQTGSSGRKTVLPAVATLFLVAKGRLDVSLTDMSIVWCMLDSGQLGIVNDQSSFNAAIQEHENAGKSTLQFYVVKNSDMMNLPKHIPK